MNGAAFRPLFGGIETLRSGSARCFVSGCLLTVLFSGLCGCASREPVREATVSESPSSQPPPPPPKDSVEAEAKPDPDPNPNPSTDVQPEPPESIGKTVWATGFQGELISGVDGELYESYRSTVIERVQQALRSRNLYEGPINGVLDVPTQQAIYTFQQAVHGLQVCGVPTPRTRLMLEQGSHTDPAFRKAIRRSYG